MRIIAGQFKGKKILEPKDKNTRPLKDLVKESIFNIINHSNKFKTELNKANILDLFSGVGSFGLEALSRGAENVTFVENYTNVIEILKKNIQNLNLNERCKIIEKNIFDNLNFDMFNKKFDIIFFDPPFKEKEILSVISKIYKSKILKKDGLLIIHRHNKENNLLLKDLNILEEKKYGISKIIFSNYF
jgi:16S rRNA (guanine966-N2)-methyltransferase